MFLGGKMEEPGLVHILSHIAHEDIPGASSTTEVFSFRSQLLPFCMNQFRLHFFFNLINWQRSKSIFRVLILSKKAKAPFVPCSPCHVCRRISQWPCSVELGLYCGFLGQLDSQKRSSALITSAFPFLFLSKTNVRICHFCIYVFLGFIMNKSSKDRTQQLFFPSAPHHGPVFQLLGTFFKISPYITHLEGNI